MAFLDNARGDTDVRHAEHVRNQVIRAQQASDRGETVDLVEVTVRYSRMSMRYEEEPIVVPRDVLPNLHALAMNYLHYQKLHIDARHPDPGLSRFVALTPDKELLVIELTHRTHEPEQNQDEQRRAKLRRVRTPEGVTRVPVTE